MTHLIKRLFCIRTSNQPYPQRSSIQFQIPNDSDLKRMEIDYNDIYDTLDTGDIILFNRPCLSMGFYGGLICAGAKIIGRSPWDHVGVIIRHPELDTLFVLEASLRGVVMRPLDARVDKSSAHEVSIRRLSHVRSLHQNALFRQCAYDFALEMKNRPYEDRIRPLFNAAFPVPTRLEREYLSSTLSHFEEKINRMEEAFNNIITTFEEKPMRMEILKLETERKKIQERMKVIEEKKAVSFFENKEDQSQFFCSELVAALYIRLGILPTYPPSNSYIPYHFTSEYTKMQLGQDVTLLPEEYLRRKTSSTNEEHILKEQVEKKEMSVQERKPNVSSDNILTRRFNYVLPNPTQFDIMAALLTGLIARTLTAPLERYKILLQTDYLSASDKNNRFSLFYSSHWKGNGLHCLKMVPSLPLKLAGVAIVDRHHAKMNCCSDWSLESKSFVSGGIAGLAVTSLVYPLDVLKTRRTVGLPFTRNMSTFGLQGYLPAALGGFLYFGTTFALYEFLRPAFKTSDTNDKISVGMSAGTAIFSSLCAQSVCYPLDTLRHRLQVPTRPPHNIFRNLYAGYLINSIRTLPVTVISFGLYEIMQKHD